MTFAEYEQVRPERWLVGCLRELVKDESNRVMMYVLRRTDLYDEIGMTPHMRVG
jgi:hypothetical protein